MTEKNYGKTHCYLIETKMLYISIPIEKQQMTCFFTQYGPLCIMEKVKNYGDQKL